ncbi:hypothetical protein ACIQD3_22105 [Peribacillus loiseleuriae]|uniref:hypothetical protein n=1 Tax=Peribacillus loiseleuriae TaxID=1679170 RepID=UPI0037F44B02
MDFKQQANESYYMAIEYLKQCKEGDEFHINDFIRWTIKIRFIGYQVAVEIAERLKLEGYITGFSYNDRLILKVPL